jgi:hypothetical protein
MMMLYDLNFPSSTNDNVLYANANETIYQSAHNSTIKSIEYFGKSKTQIITASEDQMMRIWDINLMSYDRDFYDPSKCLKKKKPNKKKIHDVNDNTRIDDGVNYTKSHLTDMVHIPMTENTDDIYVYGTKSGVLCLLDNKNRKIFHKKITPEDQPNESKNVHINYIDRDIIVNPYNGDISMFVSVGSNLKYIQFKYNDNKRHAYSIHIEDVSIINNKRQNHKMGHIDRNDRIVDIRGIYTNPFSPESQKFVIAGKSLSVISYNKTIPDNYNSPLKMILLKKNNINIHYVTNVFTFESERENLCITKMIQQSNNYSYCSMSDGSIVYVDIITGQLVNIFGLISHDPQYDNCVNDMIKLDNNMIVTGDRFGIISLYDNRVNPYNPAVIQVKNRDKESIMKLMYLENNPTKFIAATKYIYDTKQHDLVLFDIRKI